MKAVCLRTFLDAETGDLRKEGTRFDTTPERLSAINSTKYGQLAAEVDEKPAEGPSAPQEGTSKPQKPKRRTRRTKE